MLWTTAAFPFVDDGRDAVATERVFSGNRGKKKAMKRARKKKKKTTPNAVPSVFTP